MIRYTHGWTFYRFLGFGLEIIHDDVTYVHLIAGSLIDIFQNYKCLSQSKEAYLPQFYKQGQALVFNLEAWSKLIIDSEIARYKKNEDAL